jgi:hypothetical protein
VSFSKDGLISASVLRLTKRALAIAVITGTDSCSTLVCRSSCARRGGDGDAVTARPVRALGSMPAACPVMVALARMRVVVAMMLDSRDDVGAPPAASRRGDAVAVEETLGWGGV